MPNFHAFTSTQTKTKWSGVVDTLKMVPKKKNLSWDVGVGGRCLNRHERYCTRLDHGICPITIVMNTFYVL